MCVALGIAFFAGCSSDSGRLSFEVGLDPDVMMKTVRYDARFFRQETCEGLAIFPRRVDRTLTATANVMSSATAPDGFTPVDLSGFAGSLSVDIRAVDGSGNTLARRCTSVLPETAEAGFRLARFVPDGSTFEVLDDAAIVAGAQEKAAVVKVVDATGKPVENAFVSIGKASILAATDAMGIAQVRTPTETANFSGTLDAKVYGIANVTKPIYAETLAAGRCPEIVWSRDIVPGVTGAPTEIALAELGSLAFIAILRPTSAAGTTTTLELLRLDADASAGRTVGTTTTSAVGPIAALATSDGNATIAMARMNGDLEIWRFDGASGALSLLRVLPTELRVGGRIRRLLVSEGLLVVVGDVPHEVRAYAGFMEPAADLIGAQRGIIDAQLLGLLGDRRLIVSTSTSVASYLEIAGVFGPEGPVLSGVGGSILGKDPRSFVVLSRTSSGLLSSVGVNPARGALEVLGISHLGAELSGVGFGDLNGDHTADLLGGDAMGRGAPLILGSKTHRFLDVQRCTVDLDFVTALSPGGGVRPRWLGRVVSTGKLALLEIRG